jgi:glycosyltransferase involved in cell wall biosynthesis
MAAQPRLARPLRILTVTTRGTGSGAERVAWNLFTGYRSRGHSSWLAVGTRDSSDADVFEIPNDASRSAWSRLWLSASRPWLSRERDHHWAKALRLFLAGIGDPTRATAQMLGHEDFHYPGARRLLELPPKAPEIVHAHNLHGGYFDLRQLPRLSCRVPVVLTLHDAWLFSGHCAHSFDCERWRTGCGHCPDLTIYPAVARDATSFNFRRKQRIYAASTLHIAVPSRWLAGRLADSMLAPAARECRVIRNGVDLVTFTPADRGAARERLGLPRDTLILLFAANGILRNPWKDFRTLRRAVARAAESLPGRSVILLALGEDAPVERAGGAEIRFLPYQSDHEFVAAYFHAADLYVHAARAETFPNTVLEALACATPVVASAVGGVLEQVRGLRLPGADMEQPAHGPEQGTGMLVPPGDPKALAAAIVALAENPDLRRRVGENAARDARARFDQDAQVEAYLEWFREILERAAHGGRSAVAASAPEAGHDG